VIAAALVPDGLGDVIEPLLPILKLVGSGRIFGGHFRANHQGTLCVSHRARDVAGGLGLP
jgi:hypothetical protein